MTKFDFNANRQQAEKQYNLGKGEYFKVKDGDNKLRLVSACLPHPGEYQGKPNFKWLCQVLDLADGKIKPYFMPDKIYKNICDLQMDEDYSFDEVPMPYNINIKAENAGTKEVKYSVIPSPKRIALTVEQLKAIEDAPSVQDLQAKIREVKQDETPAGVVSKAEAAQEMSEEDKDLVDSIPF